MNRHYCQKTTAASGLIGGLVMSPLDLMIALESSSRKVYCLSLCPVALSDPGEKAGDQGDFGVKGRNWLLCLPLCQAVLPGLVKRLLAVCKHTLLLEGELFFCHT